MKKRCAFCEEIIEGLSFSCKYCGKIHCGTHRLPENHECTFILVSNSLGKLFNPDILEFMEKDLSVADIHHYFTINEFSAEKTIELLQYFLENNKHIENRVNAIHALKLLKINDERIFSILEECVISDKDTEVKDAAIGVLKQLYPEKSKNLINWYYNSTKGRH